MSRSHRTLAPIAALFALTLAAVIHTPALAQTAEAPSVKIGAQTSTVTPASAQTYYGTSTTSTASTSFGRSDEVKALARALDYDAPTIFRWVRDNVELHPVFGTAKGPLGTILDKEGTAFDQAVLTAELLRESSGKAGHTISATIAIGTATLTPAQFTAWTGFTNARPACETLADDGVPALVNGASDCTTLSGALTSVQIGHAWLNVTIDGVTTTWDPAYKAHVAYAGSDLNAAGGYTAGTAKSTAQSGTTTGTASGVAWVKGFNETGLETLLANTSVALESSFPQASRSPKLIEVTGGLELTPSDPGAALVYAPLSYAAWTGLGTLAGVPDKFRAALVVDASSGSPLRLYTDEIHGRRLYYDPQSYNASGPFTLNYKLMLDGTVLQTKTQGANQLEDTRLITADLAVDLPYAAASGLYMDRKLASTFTLVSGASVVLGLGRVGEGYQQRIGKGLGLDQTVSFYGATTNDNGGHDPTGLRTDLARMRIGAAWLRQFSQMASLQADVAKARLAHHVTFGVSFARTSIAWAPGDPNDTLDDAYIIGDEATQLDLWSSISARRLDDDAAKRTGLLKSVAAAGAALEGSVLAEVLDLADVSSTPAKFRWANQPAGANNDTDAGTYAGPYRFYLFNAANVSAASTLITNDGGTGAVLNAHPRDNLIADLNVYATTYGLSVVTPADAMLGPGVRKGTKINEAYPEGITKKQYSGFNYQLGYTRGAGFVALSADGTAIAQTITNRDSLSKGGGATAHPEEISELGAPKPADLLKGNADQHWSHNIDLKSGVLTYARGPLITAGSGEAPYALSFERTYESGPRGPDDHVWRHNWDMSAEISSSGLEAMGASQPRGAVPSLAAFLVMQDLYADTSATSTDIITREAAAPMAAAWWADQLNHNVVSLRLGNETAQFLKRTKKPSGDPGPDYWAPADSGASLTVAGAPVRKLWGVAGSQESSRQWDYTPVTGLTYTDAGQNVVSFALWQGYYRDPWDTSPDPPTRPRHGWRAASWAFKRGVTINFTYAQTACGLPSPCSKPRLTQVANDFGWKLQFQGETDNPTQVTAVAPDASSRTLYLTETSERLADGRRTDYAFTIKGFQLGGGPDPRFDPGAAAYTGTAVLLAAVSQPGDLDGSYGTDPSFKFDYDLMDRVQTAYTPVSHTGATKTYAADQYLVAEGRRGKRIDPLGFASSAIYDLYGRPVWSLDASDRLSWTDFDGLGRRMETRLRLRTDAASVYAARSTFDYDALGNERHARQQPDSANAGLSALVTEKLYANASYPKAVTSEIDPLGHALVTTYDSLGRVTETDGRAGEVTQTSYDSHGLPTQTKVKVKASPLTWRITNRTYRTDGLPDTVKINDPAGVSADLVTTFGWTSFGELNLVTDAAGRQTSAAYDAAGRLIQIKRAPSTPAVRRTIEYDYESNGQLAMIRQGKDDPATQWLWTTIGYSEDGRPSSIKDSSGNVTSFTYDARRYLLSVTDGAGRQTQYRYEPTGEQSCEIRGYGTGLQQTTRRTTFTVLSKPDKLYPARGADASCGTLNATYATTFGYDAYGRSVRTTYPDASYELDTLDDAGRATTHRNRSGQALTSSFDDSGRPLVRTTPEGTYTSVYDLSGLKLSEVYAPAVGFTAKARTVTWVYDFAARLTSEGANDGVRSLTVGYGYDAAGLRTSIVWPDSWTATYGYDALGRPTSVANGATTLATYGWDRLSRRTTTGFGAGPAAHIDALYQPDGDLAKLTEAFNGLGVDLRYGYDGSRRQTARGSTSAAWLWRATAGATTSYGAANPTDQYPTVGAESQTWDTRGNLATWGTRSFTHDSENRLRSATVSGATTAYEYDPLGRRVEKLPNGATSTRYLHAGDEEIGEYDGSTGALIQRFVPGPATDERAAVVSAAGTATWLMSDRQGTVVATTTSTGALAQAYAYDPYGNEITGAPTTGNAWRYTGRRFDPETGLYYYRARYYAPVIGRFVETDPIGYEGGVNLYAYVGNDPANGTDPSGKRCSTSSYATRIGAACSIDNIVEIDGNKRKPTQPEINRFRLIVRAAERTLDRLRSGEFNGNTPVMLTTNRGYIFPVRPGDAVRGAIRSDLNIDLGTTWVPASANARYVRGAVYVASNAAGNIGVSLTHEWIHASGIESLDHHLAEFSYDSNAHRREYDRVSSLLIN